MEVRIHNFLQKVLLWEKRMETKFKRYSETAGSAGYDLYSAVKTTFIPFKPELVKSWCYA